MGRKAKHTFKDNDILPSPNEVEKRKKMMSILAARSRLISETQNTIDQLEKQQRAKNLQKHRSHKTLKKRNSSSHPSVSTPQKTASDPMINTHKTSSKTKKRKSTNEKHKKTKTKRSSVEKEITPPEQPKEHPSIGTKETKNKKSRKSKKKRDKKHSSSQKEPEKQNVGTPTEPEPSGEKTTYTRKESKKKSGKRNKKKKKRRTSNIESASQLTTEVDSVQQPPIKQEKVNNDSRDINPSSSKSKKQTPRNLSHFEERENNSISAATELIDPQELILTGDSLLRKRKRKKKKSSTQPAKKYQKKDQNDTITQGTSQTDEGSSVLNNNSESAVNFLENLLTVSSQTGANIQPINTATNSNNTKNTKMLSLFKVKEEKKEKSESEDDMLFSSSEEPLGISINLLSESEEDLRPNDENLPDFVVSDEDSISLETSEQVIETPVTVETKKVAKPSNILSDELLKDLESSEDDLMQQKHSIKQPTRKKKFLSLDEFIDVTDPNESSLEEDSPVVEVTPPTTPPRKRLVRVSRSSPPPPKKRQKEEAKEDNDGLLTVGLLNSESSSEEEESALLPIVPEPTITDSSLLRDKGRFTSVEDTILLDAIDNYLLGKQIDLEDGYSRLLMKRKYPELKECWDDIGTSLPKRDTQAIYHRARRLLSLRTLKQKNWTNEELDKLCDLVDQYGTNWVEIGRELNRLDSSCRDRYRLLVDYEGRGLSSVVRFTEEEDKLLEKYVNLHQKPDGSIKWTTIGNLMPNRNVLQLHYYWNHTRPRSKEKRKKFCPLPKEDLLLLSNIKKSGAVEQTDINWKAIAQGLLWDPIRARDRYIQLKKSLIPPAKELGVQEAVNAIIQQILPIQKRIEILQKGPGNMTRASTLVTTDAASQLSKIIILLTTLRTQPTKINKYINNRRKNN